MEEWKYYPRFLDLSTSRRRVVRFTPLLLYPHGMNPRYLLDRLGGSQSLSGRYGEVKIPYRKLNSNPSVAQPVASRYSENRVVR
jgi:hypothetical protein